MKIQPRPFPSMKSRLGVSPRDTAEILDPMGLTAPWGTASYVPPNWTIQKALYVITFPANQNPQQATGTYTNLPPGVDPPIYSGGGSGPGFSVSKQMSMFVFDAIRRAQHRLSANVTQHPVQSGFNLSDHVVRQGTQLVLEIAMSDAIASYNVSGFTPMWDSTPSKSVSAFQRMEFLFKSRQIMTINTRLETYNNMVLTSIESEDNQRTYFGGLAMTLTFQEIFVANIATQANAVRPQVTGETPQGTVRSETPDPTTVSQHQVPTPAKPAPYIPGAGIMQSPIISSAITALAQTGVISPLTRSSH